MGSYQPELDFQELVDSVVSSYQFGPSAGFTSWEDNFIQSVLIDSDDEAVDYDSLSLRQQEKVHELAEKVDDAAYHHEVASRDS